MGIIAYREIANFTEKAENFGTSLGQSASNTCSQYCTDQAKEYGLKISTRYANEINKDLEKMSEQVESIALSLENLYKNSNALTGEILPLPEMYTVKDKHDKSEAASSIFAIDLKNSSNGKYVAYNLPEYEKLSSKNVHKASASVIASITDEEIKQWAKVKTIVSNNVAPESIIKEMKLISNVKYIAEPLYKTNENLENIAIGTETGIRYNCSNFDSYVRYLPSTRAWYKDALAKPNGVVWQRTYKSVNSGNYCLTCSKAFKGSQNQLLGVVEMDMSLKKMNENISNPKLSEGEFVFILDSSGRFVACKDYESKFANLDPLNDSNMDENYKNMISNVISKRNGNQECYLPIFGQNYIVSFAPLDTSNWFLCIATPISELRVIGEFIGSDIKERLSNSIKEFSGENKSKIGPYLTLFFTIIAISVLLSFLLARLISKPLLKLADGVKRIGEGNFEGKVEVDSKDEVGQLADEFNKMANNLKLYVDKLQKTTVEKVKLNSEMNVAKTIQEDMLPCIFPKRSEQKAYDVFASMDPAKAVGGDFYDFFLIDKDHLCLVIADVSGKSISAALFMVITKTLIKNYACLGYSPEEVFNIVNKQLCENNKAEMFVTSFIAIVDLKTGKAKCCNAGHNKPLIYRKSEKKFDWLNTNHGFVLAGFDTVKYKLEELDLSKGDALYLYTDGVTEAINTKKELFSDDRLINKLNSIKVDETSSENILKDIKKCISDFASGEPQADDITMLMFIYLGEGNDEDDEDG